MALVAALGTLNLGDRAEAAAAAAVLEERALAGRLDELADAGLVVEEEPKRFTIKPDILREHTFRFSFFPDSGRRISRYEDIYTTFATTRLRSLLQALGDARADLAPGAAPALALVRAQLITLLDRATTAADLARVAELVRALGPGGADTGMTVAEQLLEKIQLFGPGEFDVVGRVLADALSAAKFGRDQLPRAWGLVLSLARLAFAGDGAETKEAVLSELRGIYSAVPINYSSNDPYVLAYVQQAVSDQTLAWWENEGDLPGAAQVAAAAVRPAFVLQLEQHRQAAGNAMAINLMASFLPASRETETMIRLGARLFIETLLMLAPGEQLEQLKTIESLEHVAGGYSGMLGLTPSKELQLLAATVLAEIETWLAEQMRTLSLPVAGAVVSHFGTRGRRPRGVPRVKLARPTGELREYLDLIDSRARTALRNWEKELAETRERGRKYGRKLALIDDPKLTVDRWTNWIDEFEVLTGNTTNNTALDSALGEVAAIDPDRARGLAEYAIENERSISRFMDSLLDTLVAVEDNWPLVEQWMEHPSAHVRGAAVRAVYRADDGLARPVLTALINDPANSVRGMVLQALMYGPADGPSDWRLDLALGALEANDDPLPALDQLLAVVRHRSPEGKVPMLSAAQKSAIREVVLATASADRLPSHQRLATTLGELEHHGIDVVLDWLQARLEHVRRHHNSGYMQPLPSELEPLVRSRRTQASARAELARLLDEVEKASTDGMYRYGVDEAIQWLGGDADLVTRKIDEWIRGGPRLRRLALSFVNTSNWKVFTKRAKIVLDARPNEGDVARFLIGGRYPRSWIGSMEPYFLSQAEAFRRWTRSHDPRLKALGAEAVAEYERLAEEALARERQEQETF